MAESLFNIAGIVGLAIVAYAIRAFLIGEVYCSEDRSVYKRSEDKWGFWSNTVLMLGLGVGLVGMWFLMRSPSKFAYWNHPFTPAKANKRVDRCLGKERCIVVYVAPWCPACESIQGCLKEAVALTEGMPDFGVDVVMGYDKEEKLEAGAVGIGAGVYVDTTGDIRRALRVKSLPTFFAVNRQGKILHHVAGAPRDCDLDSIKQMLKM